MNEPMDTTLLSTFLGEAQENLARLEREFVVLEQEPDNAELLRDVFRIMHSIKGIAGFLNLRNVEQVAHQIENVLTTVRDHIIGLDAEIISTMLSAVDGMKAILLTIQQTGEEGEHDIQAVVASLQKCVEGKPTPTPSLRQSFDSAQDDRHGEQPVLSLSKESRTHQDTAQEGKSQEQHLPKNAAQPASSAEDARIHLEMNVLDRMMSLVGELVLARNRAVQLAVKDTIDVPAFRAVTHHLNTIVSELQETLMKTRMQPVKSVFEHLQQVVQELSTGQGKEVELQLEGQETELDRTLLDAIREPLQQLVRNAVEHGIEPPEVRRQQGKPPTGAITVQAHPEGGQVHIDIADDGEGIDVAQLKANAVKEGLMTAQQAESASERSLLNLLLQAGGTTGATAASRSGHGEGLEVVRRNLDRIGGTVEMQTELHNGTRWKLRIPVTLAIIPVLIVKAAGHRFAIPQMNLEELLMLQDETGKRAGIERISGAEVYRLRGELLPLLRLDRLFQLVPAGTAIRDNASIVVVSAGSVRFGIVIDDVGDTEEIVVKPLSSHIRRLPCYDGATIMGDGDVTLILNVNGLLTAAQVNLEEVAQAAQQRDAEQEAQAGFESETEQQQTVVLFRAGKDEYYGVPLAFVTRLEELPAAQIEHSGGREVLQYHGDVLPLMRLEPYLNIETTPDPNLLALIVFSVDKQIGLAVREILNTVEISTHIDTETFQQKGILGSTIVEGHSVLIVDIHGLIEMAYPMWYKKFFVSTLSDEERQQIRVLLVEDSAFFQNIEKSYLESAGYQVYTAWHGREALEHLETHPIDVVVTDIDMPYCDGYELTKAIRAREDWKHLPVMAVTVLSGEENRRKGMEAGIDEYKIKLDRDEVLKTLEQLILRYRRKGA